MLPIRFLLGLSNKWILLALLPLLGCAGKEALPAPAPRTSKSIACAKSYARTLQHDGQLLSALDSIRGESPSKDADCKTEQERSSLESEILVALGDCKAAQELEGNAADCRASDSLSPEEAVTQSQKLRASGDELGANLVLARTRYAAEKFGSGVSVVPSWLLDVDDVKFFPPGRFVVSHAQGTSIFEGEGWQEVRRCENRILPHTLSPNGRFASLAEFPERLLDLTQCKVVGAWGKPFDYSEDEKLILTLHADELSVRELPGGTVLWKTNVPLGEERKELKTGCFSPSGEGLILSFGFGKIELRNARDGGIRGMVFLRQNRIVRNHLGANIDPSAQSCAFSPDGSKFAVATQRSALIGPFSGTMVWDWESMGEVGEFLVSLEQVDRWLEKAIHDFNNPAKLCSAATASEACGSEASLPLPGRVLLSQDRSRWAVHHEDQLCVGKMSSAVAESCTFVPEAAQVSWSTHNAVLLVVDRNRYQTYSVEGEILSAVTLLPRGRHRAMGDGRWIMVGNTVWDTKTQTSLPAQNNKVPDRLYFHAGSLCVGQRCFGPSGHFDFIKGVGGSEISSVRGFKYYPRVHPRRGLLINPAGVSNREGRELARWEFPYPPGNERRGSSELGEIVDGRFNLDGSEAWLLFERGRLLRFSTEEGSLLSDVTLDSKCLSGFSRGGALQVAPTPGVSLVRASEEKGCTFFVDLESLEVRAAPFAVSGNFSLSGDGRSMVVSHGDDHALYSVPGFRPRGTFRGTGHASELSLSYSGKVLLGAAPPYDAGAFKTEPGQIWRRGLGAEEVTPMIEVPDPPGYSWGDERPLPVDFSQRLVARDGSLYTYEGKKAATISTRGRRAVVTYPDGKVELFSPDQETSFTCLVSSRVVPRAFCRNKIVPAGRLEQLLLGSADSPQRLGYVTPQAKEQLPEHCLQPIVPCGEEVSLDASYLTCRSDNSVDHRQLSCLTRVRNAEFSGLASLGGFPQQFLSRLERLTIWEGEFSDLTPLRHAYALTSLRLSSTQVEDVAPLSELSSLSYLDLSRTKVARVAPLKKMKALESLNLSQLNVVDLDQLMELESLESVEVGRNEPRSPQLEALLDALRVKAEMKRRER